MSDLQWLFLGFYAVIFFIVAVPILFLILWVINKWLLKRKIRLLYRVLLSIAIPLAFVGFIFAYIHYSFYSTSNMNCLLEDIGVGIKLPLYEITEYKNEWVVGDDFRDTYQMVFNDDRIKSMLPALDSVCNANKKWRKMGDDYVFITFNNEKEYLDSLIVRPRLGTATFVRLMW